MGWNHKLRVWDVKTGKLLRDLQNTRFCIRAVKFIEGNGLVAYGVSGDGFLVSLGIERATEKSLKLNEFPAEALAHHTAIKFTPDFNLVAIIFENTGGRVWDTATGDLRSTLVNSDGLTLQKISANNKLLTQGHTAKVQVWDILTGALIMAS